MSVLESRKAMSTDWVINKNSEGNNTVLFEDRDKQVFAGAFKGQPVTIKLFKNCKSGCLNQFERELEQVLSLKDHLNILKTIAFSAGDRLCLIQEGMGLLQLREIFQINEARGGMNARQVASLVNQIARGLECLHSADIPHRYLAPQHVLCSLDCEIVKLSDFGLPSLVMLVEADVPLRYWDPEVFNQSAALNFKEIDVYAYGVIVWEALSNLIPYAEYPNNELASIIPKKVLRISDDFPNHYKELIQSCWKPYGRPIIQDIVSKVSLFPKPTNFDEVD